MLIEYSKDLYHNYLRISEQAYDEESPYCIRMLEAEGLCGILKPDCRRQDEQVYYYYDITAKQSLSSLLVKSTLSKDSLKQLLSDVIEAALMAYEYLLDEAGFLISPETIFFNLNTGKYEICYLPGYGKDAKAQMISFMEFLMNKVDYNDKEAVLLIYNLYAAGKEEGYAFDHMLQILHKFNQPKQEARNGRSSGLNHPERNMDSGTDPEDIGSDIVSNTAHGPNARDSVRPFQALPPQPEVNRVIQKPYPVMLEKESREQEAVCYPLNTYLGTAGCCLAALLVLILCMKTKLCYNSLGYRIDYSKLFAVLLILFCSCGYLIMKLWDKKNRITKMITIKEYHDPRREAEPAIPDRFADETVCSQEKGWKGSRIDPQGPEQNVEAIEPTSLLNAAEPECGCVLKPVEESGYDSIPIKNFPFFIGKLKKNVDYCIEKEVVSRYHAKITREGDRFYLTDLNSTNGTFLNREVLMTYQQKELKPGDEVSFANIRYVFIMN